jgi:hypothetical protein
MNALMLILAVVILLLAAFAFSARAIRRACQYILKDLERQKALDPDSAIDLPYCKRQLLRFGLRDYRPDALNYLLRRDFVRVSPEGKFYLGKTLEPGDQGEGLFRREV